MVFSSYAIGNQIVVYPTQQKSLVQYLSWSCRSFLSTFSGRPKYIDIAKHKRHRTDTFYQGPLDNPQAYIVSESKQGKIENIGTFEGRNHVSKIIEKIIEKNLKENTIETSEIIYYEHTDPKSGNNFRKTVTNNNHIYDWTLSEKNHNQPPEPKDGLEWIFHDKSESGKWTRIGDFTNLDGRSYKDVFKLEISKPNSTLTKVEFYAPYIGLIYSEGARDAATSMPSWRLTRSYGSE